MITMKRKNVALAVSLAGLVAACTSAGETDHSSRGAQAVVDPHAVGQSIGAYEMRLRDRSQSDVAARLRAVVEMVDGRVSRWDELDRAVLAASGQRTGMMRPFTDTPSIIVEHDADIDMLRVLREREPTIDGEGPDVGDARAREVVAAAFEQLASRGLLRREDYDLSTAHVGRDQAGRGDRAGRERVEWTVAYRFSLRRRVEGIPVLNAGVQFIVHRSGQLDGVRLGGVELVSTGAGAAERPAGSGRAVTRRVSDAEIQARFRSSLPSGAETSIRFEGLAYVLPDGARSSVVEPLYVLAYSTITGSGDQRVASRLQTVGYSITDPGARPRYLFETVDPAIGATATPTRRR